MLARRLAWRGFDAVLTVVEPGEPLPDTGHVYLLYAHTTSVGARFMRVARRTAAPTT